MFIVLKAVNPDKRFLVRCRQKKRLSKSEPVLYPTENGLPFFILEVLDGNHGINRSEIEEKCGRYVSRIIAPRDLHLPDNGKIKRFIPNRSNAIFIFNTAVDAISKAQIEPNELCITVLDRGGIMSGEINRLLPLASSVRVITSHPERYVAECEKIFNSCGASIIVRPVYQYDEKKEIIISCDGSTTQDMSNSVVFSFKRGIYGKIRFYSHEICLSDNHSAVIPKGIDSVDFAAAVTELCGSSEYKHSCFSTTEISCSECNDSEKAKCLRCYIAE